MTSGRGVRGLFERLAGWYCSVTFGFPPNRGEDEPSGQIKNGNSTLERVE